MNKTIIVEVTRSVRHPKYQKRYTITKKFYADDPQEQYNEGDSVTIYETRPLSKLKRWTVIKPTEKAEEKITA